ncbi:MAG: hypothetical protein ACI94O_001690, partial [Octadecabacter sp.]
SDRSESVMLDPTKNITDHRPLIFFKYKSHIPI